MVNWFSIFGLEFYSLKLLIAPRRIIDLQTTRAGPNEGGEIFIFFFNTQILTCKKNWLFFGPGAIYNDLQPLEDIRKRLHWYRVNYLFIINFKMTTLKRDFSQIYVTIYNRYPTHLISFKPSFKGRWNHSEINIFID